MLGSLRVRLPLVFLTGILLAGLVTTLIAIRLFRDIAHDQALSKLSREANGIATLYARAVPASYANKSGKKSSDRGAPTRLTADSLELATGDKLFFMGPHRLFPGQKEPISRVQRLELPSSTFDWISGKSGTFEFTPPGAHQRYYAVANPITIGRSGETAGAIIVATKKTDVTRRVYSLVERLAIAGILGLLVAGALSWYLSRRI